VLSEWLLFTRSVLATTTLRTCLVRLCRRPVLTSQLIYFTVKTTLVAIYSACTIWSWLLKEKVAIFSENQTKHIAQIKWKKGKFFKYWSRWFIW